MRGNDAQKAGDTDATLFRRAPKGHEQLSPYILSLASRSISGFAAADAQRRAVGAVVWRAPGARTPVGTHLEPHRQVAELIAHLLDLELGLQSVSLPGTRLIPSLFKRWAPDLVLAEIPIVQGIPSAEDLEYLRPVLDIAQAQGKPLPVILCTTYMEVSLEMARSAGFAALIYKPFLPDALVATVRSALLGHVAASRA